MASEFSTEFFSANRIVKADLRAARTPREEDLDRIKKEVCKLYDATEVILNVTVDDSLLSGYVLQIGDRVFDNSGRHAIDQMMADKPSLATLKTRVEDYKPAATSEEGGVVVSSADGIVEVEGMDRAVYGEIVTFENGAKGMVESVEPGRLGIMLFDGAESVGVGTMVTRSGKRTGIYNGLRLGIVYQTEQKAFYFLRFVLPTFIFLQLQLLLCLGQLFIFIISRTFVNYMRNQVKGKRRMYTVAATVPETVQPDKRPF